MYSLARKGKTVMNKCMFDIALVGQCSNSATHRGYCEVHVKEKCIICGEQATHECPETLGLVCGSPLCDNFECRVKHHPKYYDLTLEQWCRMYNLNSSDSMFEGVSKDEVLSYNNFVDLFVKGVQREITNKLTKFFNESINVEVAYPFENGVVVQFKEPIKYVKFTIDVEEKLNGGK